MDGWDSESPAFFTSLCDGSGKSPPVAARKLALQPGVEDTRSRRQSAWRNLASYLEIKINPSIHDHEYVIPQKRAASEDFDSISAQISGLRKNPAH
jgi:hypothetical protein